MNTVYCHTATSIPPVLQQLIWVVWDEYTSQTVTPAGINREVQQRPIVSVAPTDTLLIDQTNRVAFTCKN